MEQIKRLNPYLKERFNKKIYKIALNPLTTCPNRDGTIGTGGCIFCSKGGSGDFAASGSDIKMQIDEAIERISSKVPEETGYIAYFQAYTGTYGNPQVLEQKYMEAAEVDRIVAVSIATRPDCLDEEILNVLSEIAKKKPLIIELGLQTSKEESVKYIRRGYDNYVFTEAVDKLRKIGAEVVVHVIIGLPGEDKSDVINTVEFVNMHDVQGIKLQLLHVLKETDLETEYVLGKFEVLSLEEYTDILCDAIEHIRDDIILHRITGDGPKKILIAPEWSKDKKRVLNYINKALSDRNIVQGRRYENHGNGFVDTV